ncbi:IS5 family transposase [Methylomicrobium sp. Wu6]|uniref:IS5 family transposase n=1 Tax=Methylomicrobium sp. Wu6 TaxID=3107928 RepID=UPI002DD69BD3|nr:IS5 family transposase [Methylomicrobium sp. Wu6]MEC4749507.1 IS5 family transposase [Methylomicrobium sp. Wu6]
MEFHIQAFCSVVRVCCLGGHAQRLLQFHDLQAVFIDSTVNRAHPCAAGAAKSNAEDEALGRSRGGFSAKVHTITDALGNPLDFVLTGGQTSDTDQAEALLRRTPADAESFVGDKGCDADTLVQAIKDRGMTPRIPSRGNRLEARECDWHVYKERHLIECFFNKIKHYRRVFSRHEKRARNYRGFLRSYLAALIMSTEPSITLSVLHQDQRLQMHGLAERNFDLRYLSGCRRICRTSGSVTVSDQKERQ